MLSESRSRVDELDFWDEELVSEGGYVMAHRLRTVRELSELAGRIYMDLTGAAEGLGLVYRPSVPLGEDKSDEALGQYLRQALETHRQRELAQGITTIGPHRDDIQLLVEDKDAGAYASRGQSRTAVLALKLAEAQCLEDRGGEEPVLLLDDVLSELDTYRRSHVLERVSRYQQCFITTTDVESVDERFRSRMSRFAVQQGQVTEAGLR
jgi:DNA replication and repair protein RecF